MYQVSIIVDTIMKTNKTMGVSVGIELAILIMSLTQALISIHQKLVFSPLHEGLDGGGSGIHYSLKI